MAEDQLATSAPLLTAALQLTDDPSSLVRFQLAFSLGASQDAQAATALVKILRKDGNDPWVQTAVLSSSAPFAARLLEQLAQAGQPNLSLLTRLAAVVGARHEESELIRALNLVGNAKAGADAWRRAILEGLGQGLKDSRSSLSRLWGQPPAGLQPAIERTRAYFEQAATTARDEKKEVPARLDAVRLLAYGPFPVTAPALQELLGPQSPVELQLAAVRALSAHEQPRVAEILLAAWNGYSPALRREVGEALFAQPQRLQALLDAVEKKQLLAGQLDPARREQLRKHRDRGIRQRAQSLLADQATPNRQAVVSDYRAALELMGDAKRGREVFKKTCSTCHRLENVGTEVGPDLLAALRTKSREALLTDLLDPSREVDPRYINYIVTTKAGRVVTGLIAVESPASVTLRRAERAEDTILRSQIDEIQATAKSVMPEELEKQLSKQDVADVIAYLLAVR